MSHRFAALAVVLGAVILTASGAAIWVGLTDVLLASSGPRRAIAVEALGASDRGWFLLDACVRHDLAVVVTGAGTAYKLGEPGVETAETDRIFTPLSARTDCNDESPPRQVYALVEDAASLSTTLQRGGRARIAPPPIPATVEGTVGPRVTDEGLGRRAAALLAGELPGVGRVPFVKKDGRPGSKWVALLTMTVGLHGLLLLAVGAVYLLRRARRGEVAEPDAEASFFQTETLD